MLCVFYIVMAIQNGGKERHFAECEVEGSRSGIQYF